MFRTTIPSRVLSITRRSIPRYRVSHGCKAFLLKIAGSCKEDGPLHARNYAARTYFNTFF